MARCITNSDRYWYLWYHCLWYYWNHWCQMQMGIFQCCQNGFLKNKALIIDGLVPSGIWGCNFCVDSVPLLENGDVHPHFRLQTSISTENFFKSIFQSEKTSCFWSFLAIFWGCYLETHEDEVQLVWKFQKMSHGRSRRAAPIYIVKLNLEVQYLFWSENREKSSFVFDKMNNWIGIFDRAKNRLE